MPPLWHRLLKQYSTVARNRSVEDDAGLLTKLDDVHCFDVSAVLSAASHLASDIDRRPQKCGKLAFLPAPRLWLEVGPIKGQRSAFFIQQHGAEAHVAGVLEGPDGIETRWMFRLPLHWPSHVKGWDEIEWGWNVQDDENDMWNEAAETVCVIYALLAMINTPRIVGRRQHLPHVGLQRDIARSKGMVGKFPLRATTEIVLEVNPPRELGNDAPRTTHLSGGKALHWVRAHLRIRNGLLEMVSSHWRGDPSLGVKQSRYTVTPPRNGIWPNLAA